KPEIVVSIELAPALADQKAAPGERVVEEPVLAPYVADEFDSGPAARRAEPRPEPAPASASAADGDADLAVIEDAVRRDDRSDRQRLEDAKQFLRDTALKTAKDVARAAATWEQEHGQYFQRLSMALSSGELLRAAGDGSRDRLNRLDGIVTGTIQSLSSFR